MQRVEISRRERIVWGIALGLGLLLRLWFIAHPMPSDDDTDAYAELANNLFHHGVYGFAVQGPQAEDAGAPVSPVPVSPLPALTAPVHAATQARIEPTLIRLPGYPLFLGMMFALFGAGNFTAVLLAQVAIDLLGCWLIALFVREQVGGNQEGRSQVSGRAGTAAIFLAALCPFTAAYSAIALTECLSVFAVSLALWACGRVLRAPTRGTTDGSALLLLSMAMALAILLRPDGALLTPAVVAAIVCNGWRQGRVVASMKTALLCWLLAVLPLGPWALRNWRTFHVIQPLAPRRVNNPGEYVTYGFYRWMGTWSVDIVSTGNVFWRMGSGPIDVGDLPERAFDSPAQRSQTVVLLKEYNAAYTISPALDTRFSALATERLRAHPLLCRVWVPVLRVVDMWMRPRTETLGLDADWWRFDRHRRESLEAAGLGVVNLALLGAAVVGAVRVARGGRRAGWLALPVVYVVLRCALLSSIENPEPRYSLEAFPLVLACAACAFATGEEKNPGV